MKRDMFYHTYIYLISNAFSHSVIYIFEFKAEYFILKKSNYIILLDFYPIANVICRYHV